MKLIRGTMTTRTHTVATNARGAKQQPLHAHHCMHKATFSIGVKHRVIKNFFKKDHKSSPTLLIT